MSKATYVASFIGHEAGKAVFVGLYKVRGKPRPLSSSEFWSIAENRELQNLGMLHDERASMLWFDLKRDEGFYADWRGKLIVRWPPPTIKWWRWAGSPKSVMPIHAILEDSVLAKQMPDWRELILTWEQLKVLPRAWEPKMREWRAIYHILDVSDGKSYVGAAYGHKNIWGRWQVYAASGHGAVRQLRKRDPKNFRFSILERVEPDMNDGDVIRRENSWMERLHTREFGLNDN